MSLPRLSPSPIPVMDKLICSDLMSDGLGLFAGLGCCSCEETAQLMSVKYAEARQLSCFCRQQKQDSCLQSSVLVNSVRHDTLPTRKAFPEKITTCIWLALSYEACQA